MKNFHVLWTFSVALFEIAFLQYGFARPCQCGPCDGLINTKDRCDCCVYILNGKRSESNIFISRRSTSVDNRDSNVEWPSSRGSTSVNNRRDSNIEWPSSRRSTSVNNRRDSNVEWPSSRWSTGVNDRDLNDEKPSTACLLSVNHLCVIGNSQVTKSTPRDTSYQNQLAVLKEIAIMNSARKFEYRLPYRDDIRAPFEMPRPLRKGYTIETVRELMHLLDEMKYW